MSHNPTAVFPSIHQNISLQHEQPRFLPERIRLLSLAIVCAVAPTLRADSDITTCIAHIRAVGREGSGNVEASKAWKELVRSGPDALPIILKGFDGADATAANWLRLAVDVIGEKALASNISFPAAALETFIMQKDHSGSARRLAYEWLVRVDPKASERLLPDMLQDPSVELRRDAVARSLGLAQKRLDRKDTSGAFAEFRKALSGARDRDQVDQIAKKLKSLGQEVDLPAHFGFIRTWHLIGPFDSTGGIGFEKAYPPEEGVDLAGQYPGKKGDRLAWKSHTTQDPYGLVDLNKVLGKNMGAVGYASAAVTSPIERPVDIRAASNNAVKIFLNGKLICFREEYHHGMEMDQHSGVGTLKPGRNEILIKVCQNEQTEDWAQMWSFQLRVCDSVGGGVPLAGNGNGANGNNGERKVSP